MKEIILDLRELLDADEESEEGRNFTEWADMKERIEIETAILDLKGKIARVRITEYRGK